MSITTKILLGFLVAIFVGAGLLSLPFATKSGSPDFLTALFTSTSAVCVTGFSVVPTHIYWTMYGKVVILLLIQLGGLGVVALTSFVMLLFNRKFTLRDQMLIRGAFGLDSMFDMRRFVKRVLRGTAIVEAIGAALFMIAMIPRYGFARGIWYAVFNSVSAFCNAGIDVMGPDSLVRFSDDPLVLLVTAALIILGGLGFVVWWDFSAAWKKAVRKEIPFSYLFRTLTTHSQIVLLTSGFLIVLGTAVTLILEYDNPATIGSMPVGQKILNAFFQSVTMRTAGFVSFDQNNLTDASVLFCCMLMLIGGSPVGTAGGIRTVTVTVLFFLVLSVIRGRGEMVAFKKTINAGVVRRAVAVTLISFSVLLLCTVLLLATNNVSLSDGLYEVTNAIATVGLSRNVTPTLNMFGRGLIMVCMYLGRVGPMTMFMAFGQQMGTKILKQYAEAKIIIS